jgi:hypothetical protein
MADAIPSLTALSGLPEIEDVVIFKIRPSTDLVVTWFSENVNPEAMVSVMQAMLEGFKLHDVVEYDHGSSISFTIPYDERNYV